MEITTKINGDVAVINLEGRLDLNSSNQLKDASREFFSKDNCKLVLNMDRVDFINSSGLGALVSILKEVRNHKGELKISNLAEYVKEIFDITQLSSIFDICEDESHALNSF
ncbi:MAG: STAS domain-containing protein [Candidatus Zixiibacteriota bacterium]|nr:MAG: STAS domain-containing protein [candidate division Zixibacteria bacterium]